MRIFLALVAILLAIGVQTVPSASKARHATRASAAAPPALPEPPPLPERAPPEIRPKPATREPYGPEMPTAWDAKDIKAAEEECSRLLTGLSFEFKPLPPIRQGVCGTPAPINLKYVSDRAKVELRPAATMNCRISAALARWLREVVQPRAWDLLDARVIRVVTIGSYDCRKRNGGYGKDMISQHAFANALDITEFVTAKGEHIRLAEHWDTGDERAQFLREIHAGACKIFGTVLGPEANQAHRNHFHLDMTARRHSSYCQ